MFDLRHLLVKCIAHLIGRDPLEGEGTRSWGAPASVGNSLNRKIRCEEHTPCPPLGDLDQQSGIRAALP